MRDAMDAAVQSQPMPPEYRNYRAEVMCNDCLKTSNVAFHFLYNKVCSLFVVPCAHSSSHNALCVLSQCTFCYSYNTKVVSSYKGAPDSAHASSGPAGASASVGPAGRLMVDPMETSLSGISHPSAHSHSAMVTDTDESSLGDCEGDTGESSAYDYEEDVNMIGRDEYVENPPVNYQASPEPAAQASAAAAPSQLVPASILSPVASVPGDQAFSSTQTTALTTADDSRMDATPSGSSAAASSAQPAGFAPGQASNASAHAAAAARRGSGRKDNQPNREPS